MIILVLVCHQITLDNIRAALVAARTTIIRETT